MHACMYYMCAIKDAVTLHFTFHSSHFVWKFSMHTFLFLLFFFVVNFDLYMCWIRGTSLFIMVQYFQWVSCYTKTNIFQLKDVSVCMCVVCWCAAGECITYIIFIFRVSMQWVFLSSRPLFLICSKFNNNAHNFFFFYFRTEITIFGVPYTRHALAQTFT